MVEENKLIKVIELPKFLKKLKIFILTYELVCGK